MALVLTGYLLISSLDNFGRLRLLCGTWFTYMILMLLGRRKPYGAGRSRPSRSPSTTSISPPTRTPWDLSRSAGGSSGGAAAAVAAGPAPAAQGGDGAGSIRIPASVCGLYGIKPTRGRISYAPIVPDLAGLSTNGPIARTVADAAALRGRTRRFLGGAETCCLVDLDDSPEGTYG